MQVINGWDVELNMQLRCYDFEPMEGRPNRYVEGVVVAIDEGVGAFKLDVYEDTLFPERQRESVVVPMEMSMTEYYGRIVEVV